MWRGRRCRRLSLVSVESALRSPTRSAAATAPASPGSAAMMRATIAARMRAIARSSDERAAAVSTSCHVAEHEAAAADPFEEGGAARIVAAGDDRAGDRHQPRAQRDRRAERRQLVARRQRHADAARQLVALRVASERSSSSTMRGRRSVRLSRVDDAAAELGDERALDMRAVEPVDAEFRCGGAGEADRDDRGDPPVACRAGSRRCAATARRRGAAARSAPRQRLARQSEIGEAADAEDDGEPVEAGALGELRARASRASELPRSAPRQREATRPRTQRRADVRQPAPFPPPRGAVLVACEPPALSTWRSAIHRCAHGRLAVRLRRPAQPRLPLRRASWQRCRAGRRCGRRPACRARNRGRGGNSPAARTASARRRSTPTAAGSSIAPVSTSSESGLRSAAKFATSGSGSGRAG